MKKITLWYRFNPDAKQFEYDHYEHCWDRNERPIRIRFGSKRWAKEYAYMDGTTVKYLNQK